MTTGHLVWRALVGYRAGITTLLVLSGLVIGGVVGLQTVRAALEEARSTSVALRLPVGAYILQPLTDEARQTLARADQVVRLRDAQTQVSGKESGKLRAVSGSVRLSSQEFQPLGVLTDGRAPRNPGEAAISRSLSTALDVGPGEEISVLGRQFSVVGLMVDPGVRDALLVSGVVDHVAAADTTSWVGSETTAERLAEKLSDDVAVSSSALAELVAKDNVPDRPGPTRSLQLLLLGLGAAALALLVTSLKRAFDADSAALVQAGMAAATVSRISFGVVAGAIATGAALGVALGRLGVLLLRDELAALWGQLWVAVPAEPVASVSSAIAVTVLPFAGLWLLRRLAKSTAVASSRFVMRSGVVVGVVSLGLVAVFTADVWQRFGARDSMPLVGLVVTNVIVAGLALLRRVRRTDAVGRFVAYTGNGLVVLSLVVACAVYLSSFQAGWTWHVYEKYRLQPLQNTEQAAGALVIEGVADDVVPTILGEYADVGGRDVSVARRVSQRRWGLEAVAPSFVECVRKNPEIDVMNPPPECIRGTRSFGLVFSVGLASEPTQRRIRAAPELMEAGRVGLLLYRAADRETVADAAVLPAVADGDLGNRMPGVVLPLRHPLASRLSLQPTGASDLYLGGFPRLTVAERAQVRGALLQYAPSALPAETPSEESAFPAGVYLWSLGGAGFLLVFTTVLLLGFVTASGWIRDLMAQLGAGRRRRLRLSADVLLVPLLAPVIALAVAWGVLAFVSRTSGVGYGVFWLVPPAVAFAVLAVSVWVFSRPPGTTLPRD